MSVAGSNGLRSPNFDAQARDGNSRTCSTKGSNTGLHLTVQQAANTTSGWATIRYHGEENSIHTGGKSRRRGGPAIPERSRQHNYTLFGLSRQVASSFWRQLARLSSACRQRMSAFC
ncbi:hypothetical protein E1301_Tti014577 [Triplophysa tibetana]|uniref:Uncharacterized protein n=1 Tax=Triplophysa tibetana TaxID=1572043 RepID=A0A5A9P9Z8_9TELE|nr:hypothetical protein E1301_Tti014577 [Triplophysa tibetana]